MNLNWTVPAEQPQAIEKEAAEKKELQLTKILSIAANIKAIHVKTKRYSQHMALDQAFAALNDKLDSLNEGVQGYYLAKEGKELDLTNQEIKFLLPGDDAVLDAVRKLEKEFTTAANKLVSGVSPLEGLRDDVLNCFYQLYYRLNLKG